MLLLSLLLLSSKSLGKKLRQTTNFKQCQCVGANVCVCVRVFSWISYAVSMLHRLSLLPWQIDNFANAFFLDAPSKREKTLMRIRERCYCCFNIERHCSCVHTETQTRTKIKSPKKKKTAEAAATIERHRTEMNVRNCFEMFEMHSQKFHVVRLFSSIRFGPFTTLGELVVSHGMRQRWRRGDFEFDFSLFLYFFSVAIGIAVNVVVVNIRRDVGNDEEEARKYIQSFSSSNNVVDLSWNHHQYCAHDATANNGIGKTEKRQDEWLSAQ